MKSCSLCLKPKPLSAFHKRKASKDGLAYICKSCAIEKTARWIALNPEESKLSRDDYRARVWSKRQRGWWYVRSYGITEEEVKDMILKQGSCCAICETNDPGKRRVFFVDHDHATGKIRGMLCSRCNTGLGYFRDSIINLDRAAGYLKRHLENNQ